MTGPSFLSEIVRRWKVRPSRPLGVVCGKSSIGQLKSDLLSFKLMTETSRQSGGPGEARLTKPVSAAFLAALLISAGAYISNHVGIVRYTGQQLVDLVAASTFIPQANLSQELPLPSLPLCVFVLACLLMFIMAARALSWCPWSVRLTASLLVSLSYIVVAHVLLDTVSIISSTPLISDHWLGAVGGLSFIVTAGLLSIRLSIIKQKSRSDRHESDEAGQPHPKKPGLLWITARLMQCKGIVVSICLLSTIWAYWSVIRSGVSNAPMGWDGLWCHLPIAVSIVQFGILRPFWLGGITGLATTAADVCYAYPAAGSILYSLNLRMGADRWSFLWQMLGAALLAMATYISGKALGASRGEAMSASFACILVPIVALQSSTVMVDNISAGLAACSCALLLFVARSVPSSQQRHVLLFISGLASGLAVATKFVHLPTVLACTFITLIICYVSQNARGEGRRMFPGLAAFCLGLLLTGGYWYLRNWMLLGSPTYPFRLGLGGLTVFPGLDFKTIFAAKEFQFVQSRADWLIMLWQDPRCSYEMGTGLVGAIGFPAAAFAMILAILGPPGRAKLLAGLVSLTIAILIASWWVLTNHEPRFLIAILPMLFGALAMIWSRCPKWVHAVVGALVSLSCLAAAAMLVESVATGIRPSYDRVAQYEQGGMPGWINDLPRGSIILNDYWDGATGSLTSTYPLAGLRHSNIVVTDPTLIDCDSEADSLQRLRKIGVAWIYRRSKESSGPRCYETWGGIEQALEYTSSGHTIKMFRVIGDCTARLGL